MVLAFISRRNENGLPWEPETGDQVCSDHFVSKKKSDLPTDPNCTPSVPAVRVVKGLELGQKTSQEKPGSEKPNHHQVNKDAVAHSERLKRRHSIQQASKKDRKLQTDELHRNRRAINHDHTYCSKMSSNPTSNLTQPALAVSITECQQDGIKKVYSSGIPCEVGKLVNEHRSMYIML